MANAVKDGSFVTSKSASQSLKTSASISSSKASLKKAAPRVRTLAATSSPKPSTKVPGHQADVESGIEGGQANAFLNAVDRALKLAGFSGGLASMGLSTDISDILASNKVIYDGETGTIKVTLSKEFLSAFGKMDGVLYYWDPTANRGAGAWTEVPGSRQAMQSTDSEAVISVPFNPTDAGFSDVDTVYFQAGVNTSGLLQSVADAVTKNMGPVAGGIVQGIVGAYEATLGTGNNYEYSDVQGAQVVTDFESMSTSASASLLDSQDASISNSMEASYSMAKNSESYGQDSLDSFSATQDSLDASISTSLVDSASTFSSFSISVSSWQRCS